MKILNEVIKIREKLKEENKTVVFTNGCFDLLHRGHAEYLARAKDCGDFLIVGVNSDASIKKLKGNKRPVMCQEDRGYLIEQLKSVDIVIIFDEETPECLLKGIKPDVLVKGGNYDIDGIVGRDYVEGYGGAVKPLDHIEGSSTTSLINNIIERFGND